MKYFRRVLSKLLLLSLPGGGLFILAVRASGQTQNRSIAQQAYTVAIDDAGEIKLNGAKIGMVDDAGLLAVILQGEFKLRTQRTVIVKPAGSLLYGDVISVLEAVRESGAYEVKTEGAPQASNPFVFIPGLSKPGPAASSPAVAKPNPLTLVVEIAGDGYLSLNHFQEAGSVTDYSRLKALLVSIFNERREQHIYEAGMDKRTDLPEEQRIPKKVFVKASRSLTFSQVAQVIAAIKEAGAGPVGLQIDALSY